MKATAASPKSFTIESPYFAGGSEQMHIARRKAILEKYPQIKSLMGPYPLSALWILAIVTLPFGMAILLRDQAIWLLILAAYAIGSFANHALYVQIHEACHSLIFRSQTANKLMGIFCDFPLAIPSALAFRKYHLLHHAHLGEPASDPDIVLEREGKLVGTSPIRKILWLFFFSLSQALRPLAVKKAKFLDPWILSNTLVILLVNAAIFYFFGWKALLYLLLSTLFGLGLHPLGGRWIQEHYRFPEMKPGTQETFSYYGPLNGLCFNMGYHVEHHDFANVPWAKLPILKSQAREFYDSLDFHQSWTKVLVDFIWNPKMSGFSRVGRQTRAERAKHSESN